MPTRGGKFNLRSHPGIQYVGVVVPGIYLLSQVLIDSRVRGYPRFDPIRFRDTGEESVIRGVVDRDRMGAGQQPRGDCSAV